ncbi:MAG: type VI secretion protein IcmF/TssM N-terminal domain-containing protein, partial [Planctomycetota bacterium]
MPLRLGMAGILVCVVGGLVYALGGGQNAILTIAVFAIVGLLLGLVGWFVKARSKKKSAQLEDALENDGPESGLADESEKRERQEVRQQWQKAIEETKNAGFSLYTLPWYLLIGEPAGGKSTTLRASGLEFPVGAESISGLGGTRNCDWWFTNEAVILDTAGRFTFEEKNAPDAAGWEEFLKLAQQSRPRCPINGCIIAIPMTSLLGDEPDVIEQKATQIREKLHELEQKLSIQFPVYVLVTKCDKVLGFTEFFSRLPALEQRQLFGWSKPGDYRETVPNEQWKTVFSDLNDQLVKWRNQFLEDDAEAGDVDRLYAFPEEFATIDKPLEDYLTRIFVENRYVDPLFLRGIYFTSGIQKGAPIVSACKNLLRSASEGTDEVHLEQIFSKSRAFFIRDFYRKKVFKEQGLIQPTRAAMKRQQVVERVGYSALGVVGLLLLVFLIWGGVAVGSRSTEYKNSLAEFDDQAKRWPGAPPFSAAADLSESVEKLRTEGLAPTGLGTLFGDFARGGVSAEITKAYRSRFTRSFLNRLAEKTRSAFRVPPQTWEHYLAYENAAHSFLAFAVSGERTENGEYDLGALSPDKLETIQPFLALCAAAGQPVPNAEEWTTAYEQLRSTIAATLEGEEALSDYSSAFVIDRPAAVLMLDELRDFWVRASHSHVDEKSGLPHDFGASDNEQFRHWRQWCEIYSLNNALTKQLKVLAEVTRDVEDYDAAVEALTNWCEAFGIEAEGTDHLLAQVGRMKLTLGVRTSEAAEGDAPAVPSTVKLQRAAALVEALKERARRAFEPFGSVDYDTGSGILAGLVADRKVTVDDRFSNRVLTEFDYKADVHEFVAIEHTGGETTIAPTERFTQLAGATAKLAESLGTATLREAPQLGSDGNLSAWTELADWLDARVTAIEFEESGYKQFDDMMAQFVPLAQRAHTTRALETFRAEVLADLEGDTAKELIRGFGTGSVSLLGGSSFEFKSAKEIPSNALFRDSAVQLLDFASRLERYAVGPGDVVAYDDLGKNFRDRVGALTVRYFDEYRAAWNAAFDATQDALAEKKLTARSILDSVPQESFDKLDDPEYLVDLVAHLR